MSIVKSIPYGDDNYFVSDDGMIFSRRRQGCDGRIIRQNLNSNGYPYVDLRHGKTRKKVLIHRAVAIAFIANPDNKPCVNHKDGDKTNNSVSNLEWCTYSENMKHAISTGLNDVPKLSGERHPMHKLTETKVHQIRDLYDRGISCQVIAKQFEITKEQVANIVSGRHWKKLLSFLRT